MSRKDKNPTNLSDQELELHMMDYIAGRMNQEEAQAFDAIMASHPELSQELVELEQMMNLLDQHSQAAVPEPSAQMDKNFYAMLHEEVSAQSNKQASFWLTIKSWIQLPQVRKFSYAFSFLVMGLFMGHYMHLLNSQSAIEAEKLAIKDQQIQALTVLSLLDMPSANKRLMAVNLAAMTDQPSDAIFDALLTTLKQDSNSNVRLEALEVLARHTDVDLVRQGLLEAINQQQSPMVQIAMANLMLNLNETRAVEPLRELLQQQDLIEPVKTELNDTLNELI